MKIKNNLIQILLEENTSEDYKEKIEKYEEKFNFVSSNVELIEDFFEDLFKNDGLVKTSHSFSKIIMGSWNNYRADRLNIDLYFVLPENTGLYDFKLKVINSFAKYFHINTQYYGSPIDINFYRQQKF
jgi:hypothetical protein